VPEVTVRDAQGGDAALISEVSSAAVPYLVRSAEQVAADLRKDRRLGRQRWVATVGEDLVGTATSRRVADHDGEREVLVSVEVHPSFGSRGVGTALLLTAAGAVPGATLLTAASRDDPVSMAFAVRNGFLPEGEHEMAFVDPATVPDAGPEPHGLRATTLDALPDLGMLLETHNLAAQHDPARLVRRLTMYQLRSEWWDDPDNATDLSFGLLAPGRTGPVLAAFTSVRVDRTRGRSRSSLTLTHPDHRGLGLELWVRQRMLNALAAAGVGASWTGYVGLEAPLRTVDEALGYRPAGHEVQVQRRLPPV
jgi:GNAT superfamily N-acetyltransferase